MRFGIYSRISELRNDARNLLVLIAQTAVPNRAVYLDDVVQTLWLMDPDFLAGAMCLWLDDARPLPPFDPSRLPPGPEDPIREALMHPGEGILFAHALCKRACEGFSIHRHARVFANTAERPEVVTAVYTVAAYVHGLPKPDGTVL